MTAEAVVEVRSDEEVSIVRDMVSNVCLLMTLARGTRVDWLYCDVLSKSGETLRTVYRNSVTKRFGSHHLISPSNREGTKRFIEKALGGLKRADDEWDFRRAVDAYTDAKAEGDFLNSRALKMVICMELIRAPYLKVTNQEYLLQADVFNNAVPQIKKELLAILRTIFTDHKRDLLRLMTLPVKGMNYYPFRLSLEQMCKKAGLDPKQMRSERFVIIRNELVHRYSFHIDEIEYGPPYRQYRFLEDFVGKFLKSTILRLSETVED